MKPAPTLSTAFLHPAGQSLPEPLLALRKQRGTALVDMPLPTRKTENWKYSSKYLKLTDDMAISLPAEGKTGSSLAVPGYKVAFLNGVMMPEACEYPDLDGISIKSFGDLTDEEASDLADRLDSTLDNKAVQMARLNSARFEDGLLIRLKPEAVLDQPLFVVHEVTAEASGSAFPRIFVDAGRHSQITLVEEYISSGTICRFGLRARAPSASSTGWLLPKAHSTTTTTPPLSTWRPTAIAKRPIAILQPINPMRSSMAGFISIRTPRSPMRI